MEHVLTLEPGSGALEPDTDEESVFFIGNATMLVRTGGFTVLTDPTFVHRHESVPLGYGLTTTRVTDPAIEIDALPALDLVLLSHFHGDHFDRVAQERLDRALPILTTPQSQKQLEELGFTAAVGLDTWDTAVVTKGDRRLTVTACPGRHGPGITDYALPDVMGSVLRADGAAGGSLYISGDTLVFDGLDEIPRRFPSLDTGVFHLGGTKVFGLLVTMDAEQGVEAVRLINAGTSIPVHYDDYDVFTSGLEEFLEAAAAAKLPHRIVALRRGGTHQLIGIPQG